MDKFNSIGGGSEAATRQLEVHSALGEQQWKIERLETATADLLARLEPLYNKSGEAKCDSPKAAYSCGLAQQITAYSDRVETVESRIRAALSRLEI